MATQSKPTRSKSTTAKPAHKTPRTTVRLSKPAPAAAKSAAKKQAGPTTKPAASQSAGSSASSATPPATRDTKQARLIALLRSANGATIAQMMQATGWQAHSVRGVISGVLRKKLSLAVISEAPTAGGERLYRIAS